ncbi:phospholipase A2 [Streptosporangium amethystogenes]|uniref:phospholipase A2 n=1 Tax=Streptosporangium amethystogenes TaxID=2002 RepID=UPI0004C7743A|nr:phospholipase A2 [Streptosporangium amethystogenes]
MIIDYDAQGRVSRVAAPSTPQDTCSTPGGVGCSAVTFQYAQSTTATSAQFGDVSGQLKEISYDAAGAVGPATIVSYLYDGSHRLREVKNLRQIDGGPIETSAYTYDAAGNIVQLTTPDEGTWTLTYEALGKLAQATQVTPPTIPTVFNALAFPPAPPGNCHYANQYMTGSPAKCWAGPVPMGYGQTTKYSPRWKTTKTGRKIAGVTYDHCTAPANKPFWNDFTVPCDSHDYGYGIFYLKTLAWDKSKKASVDAVFYSLMRDFTCPAYALWRRPSCNSWAWGYYQAVRGGGGTSMKYRNEY